MKLVGLLVAASHGQLLPKLEFKGMPVPAHLLNIEPKDLESQSSSKAETTTVMPSTSTITTSRASSTVTENSSQATTTHATTTEAAQSIEEFLFSMENNENSSVSDSRNENDTTRPSRGSFDLKAAMEESRAQGYGSVTGARLRFAGTPLGDVAPIYLCKNRSGNHCCDNKDPDCFTPGGCFCDSSCRAFDDCCPDFEDECVDKKCLEETKKNSAGKLALRGIELRRMRHPEVIMVASGGQPTHVEPDGCCNGIPYNHGIKCCCNGALTDQCPCPET
ncbi:Oidioi.mRNA.OKI2018_I69.chr2.g7270.t1.cds [Oikopleura dioica]|uniref:Oidioi.mRNA.OKI2018_I69.chr2.g7270.t1.cds n=1 Tax=Oikopleura dioica TaxID=34765 RepID=A0ABN7T7Z4_OIKDI|nr:Oidioi.mRNA.OKI2018_I69.chr2.g7270.t1.cds [Oikopleura dioica]